MANPLLRAAVFTDAISDDAEARMTLPGTAHKALLLLALIILGVLFSWGTFRNTGMEAAMPWMIGGLIGGLVFCLITVFKVSWSPFTAPAYSICEGLFLGVISAMYAQAYHGIVIQAVGLTLCVFLLMLTLYSLRIIRATPGFVMAVVAATGAIALFYVVTIVLGLFGIAIPFIYSGGWIGIGFSLLVVGIAALNLILDFAIIEEGVRKGAPKYMEWYGAFALMVTLIWLYLEILRLLSKLNRR
ncbi:MAG: Bax inhibitor-1/YccA family protein [Candidatus Sumerlaeota bacterium]|nr:Bax inhibitor-1/YccA family protein [Candidatus Sumerlaeota bacterium]